MAERVGFGPSPRIQTRKLLISQSDKNGRIALKAEVRYTAGTLDADWSDPGSHVLNLNPEFGKCVEKRL